MTEKLKNFDEMKRQHDLARIAKVGSKDWIDFATTMMDSFPAIYEKAKLMNTTMYQLNNQVATSKEIVQRGIDIMTLEQISQWHGVRSFLEQDYSDYEGVPNIGVKADDRSEA